MDAQHTGQAYLILHADTLLIFKCALSRCVWPDQITKTGIALSAPCVERGSGGGGGGGSDDGAPGEWRIVQKDDSIEMYLREMHFECMALLRAAADRPI